MDDIELFVSELQLYGTPRQINLMTIIVEEFKKPNSFVKYDDILKDLRDEIRKELDLEQVNGPVWWLRFDRRAAKGEDDVPTRSNTPNIRNLGQTEWNSDLPAT